MTHPYVSKQLLGQTPFTSLLFIEIVAMRTPLRHHYLQYMYVLVGQTMDDSSPWQSRDHDSSLYSLSTYSQARQYLSHYYVSKQLLGQIPPTSSLFIEIVAMRNPHTSSIFLVRCCQRYKGHVLIAQTVLPNDVRVQWSLWARIGRFYTTTILQMQAIILKYEQISCQESFYVCNIRFFAINFSVMENKKPRI